MLGWRGMIGLIVPSNNNVVLPELYSVLPEGVAAYETRMRVEGELTPELIGKMTADAGLAGELLRQTGVDVVGYCCMGSSIIKGWDWERKLLDDLARVAPKGITSANQAMKRALEFLGARRVALVTPYPADLNALLPDFFSAGGFEVASVTGIPISNVADVRHLGFEKVYRLAAGIDTEGLDAVCLLATDMRTFSALEALERDLGLPVLSSNQALAWAVLRDLGVREPTNGFGRLLRT